MLEFIIRCVDMSILNYFRCLCCKLVPATPPQSSVAETTHVKHPTMVSFDLETTTGVKRAFDALPDNKEKKLVKY